MLARPNVGLLYRPVVGTIPRTGMDVPAMGVISRTDMMNMFHRPAMGVIPRPRTGMNVPPSPGMGVIPGTDMDMFPRGMTPRTGMDVPPSPGMGMIPRTGMDVPPSPVMGVIPRTGVNVPPSPVMAIPRTDMNVPPSPVMGAIPRTDVNVPPSPVMGAIPRTGLNVPPSPVMGSIPRTDMDMFPRGMTPRTDMDVPPSPVMGVIPGTGMDMPRRRTDMDLPGMDVFRTSASRSSHVDDISIAGEVERWPDLQPGPPESFLPSHPSFRPDMGQPPRPSGDVFSCLTPAKGQRKKQKQQQAQVIPPPAEVVKKINAKVEEIIEELSAKDKFLPSEAVRKIVNDLISRARNQNHVNVSFRDITAFSDFSKLHGRVDELIKVYCMYTPVTSIHELGIALAYSEKVSNYEDLHLGPLIKHPRICDYFKPPDDIETAPEITVHQLHGYLTKLVDKTRRGSKHSLEEYLEFVRKKQGLETASHLCVRIQSFPLLIQVC
jgi:hypothetical protein